MARQVLQVQDNVFSNRPAHYGPFWRQMHKLCIMKLFSCKRAESWASVRDEVDTTLCAANDKIGEPVNLGELIFNLTKNIIFQAAFGTQSHEEQDEFIGILQEFSKLFGAFNIGDVIPWLSWMDMQGINQRLKAARGALDGFIDKIIDERLANAKMADAEDADMVDDMLPFLGDSPAGKGGEDGDLQAYLKLTRHNIKAIIMVRQ